jgi:hypothetical protein
MSFTQADIAFFYGRHAGLQRLSRERARLERDAAADRARQQDIDFLADALQQAIASAPDRFQWLDPRRAARLLVEEFRP